MKELGTRLRQILDRRVNTASVKIAIEMESTKYLGVTCILLALLPMVRAPPQTEANFITLSHTSPQTTQQTRPTGYRSSCVEYLEQDPYFNNCTQTTIPLLKGVMQAANVSADSPNSQIFTAFCTPRGQSLMRCLMEYILMCPEIGGPGSGVPVNFRDMMETGKFEVLCESYMSETCRPKLMACMGMNESSLILEEGMIPSLVLGADSTHIPFGSDLGPYKIPVEMAVVCGPMRDLLNCITNVEEECHIATQYMEEMLQNMYKELKKHGGLDMLSYDDSKKYIMTYCPLLPSDFNAKQRCIGDSLAKPEFRECEENVSGYICDVYYGMVDCVWWHVGMDCGEAYADAITNASPLFIGGCDDGANSHEASVMTMIGATALILLGRF